MIRPCLGLAVACVAAGVLHAEAPSASRTWVNGVELDAQGLLKFEANLRAPGRIPGLSLFMRAEREIVIEQAGSRVTHVILSHPATLRLVRAQLDRSLVLAGWTAVAPGANRNWSSAWFVRGEDLLGVHLATSHRGTHVVAGLMEKVP